MIAIGNNELGPPVGKAAACPGCGAHHDIEYGDIIRNGKREPSTLLGFVKCPDGASYLVCINGRLLPLPQKRPTK